MKFEPWAAYPKYESSCKKMPRFVLDEESRQRVFYVNAIEWSSSCMEMSAIGAKNVCNMIWKRENEQESKKKIRRVLNQGDYAESKFLHKVCALASLIFLVSFSIATYNRIK